jgi:hypothetical protein
MNLEGEIILKMKHVEYDKSRFRRYIGNIGELIAQEALRKKGFEAFLSGPYFPDDLSREEKRNSYYLPFNFIQKPSAPLRKFFGNRLDTFMRYINQSDRAFNYHPDMIAKKNGEIYVIEIKTTGGIRYLKGCPLKGLLMARNYGFIPALITVNVSIKATDLTVRELTNQESLGSGLG